LVLLPRQRAILERLARLRTVERRLAERVQVVLWSAEGKTTVEQAQALGVDPQRVGRWRHRWDEASERLAAAEASASAASVEADDELEEMILEVLSDEERSGTPPKFSAEQLAEIIALACQEPKTLGLPVTHWTPRELALAAQERGIVTSISPRHIARFFGGGRSAPAQVALLAQPQDRGPRPPRGRGRSNLQRLR
jgi:putative transposase